jgi:hypothetical protein
MFGPTSRYAGLDAGEMQVGAGDGTTRTVRYVRRRLLPRLDDQTPVEEHVMAPGERLDHVAARYLSDPTRFWLLCDANPVLHPAELERVGRVVVVAMPVAGSGAMPAVGPVR